MQSFETFIIFALFFVGTIFFGVLINSLLLKFSKTQGTRNAEAEIRWSATLKPAVGGISFFICFLLALAMYPLLFKTDDYPNVTMIGLVVSSGLGFLIGLADDAYNTKPLLKFLGQVACGVVLIATDTYIHCFDWEWLNYLLTVFWVVAIMNSINMLDNMDGISTVVSISIMLTALVLMYFENNSVSSEFFLLMSIVASLIGFLFHNWHPSRVYMGDTGSMFLGVVLAFIGIKYFWNFTGSDGVDVVSKQLISILLVFIVMISDTTTVTINRILKGGSPFVGGRDHTTHHLSYLGLSDSQVGFTFLGISFISQIMVIIIYRYLDNWTHLNTLFFGAYFVLVFITLYIISRKTKPSKK